MLNPRRLRRNDVVMERESCGHWSPMGRVWKRHDADHVIVIDCMKNVAVYHEDELKLMAEYTGFLKDGYIVYDFDDEGMVIEESRRTTPDRFVYMPTLRRLKRMASVYQPHFGGCARYTAGERRDAAAEIRRYIPPSKRKKTENRTPRAIAPNDEELA